MTRILRRLASSLIPKRIKTAFRKFVKPDPFRGDNVQCTVCNAEYAMFGPYGTKQRKNALCFNCGSLERHRLLWMFMERKTDLPSGKKIRLLHFAPEKCFFKKFTSLSNIEYFPCDLFPEIFKFDKTGKIQKIDITAIPHSDNYFDVILCNHVLEHIPDDRRAMRELHRVMAKGGWGIFQVPIDYNREKTYEDFSITSPEERAIAFGQIDHVRWYGQDYKERLKSVGFDVDENDYVRKFSAAEVARFGFNSGEMIYHCNKT